MITSTPLLTTKKGGSITHFCADSGSLFRVCSGNNCLYCEDFLTAKAHLDVLEGDQLNKVIPFQSDQNITFHCPFQDDIPKSSEESFESVEPSVEFYPDLDGDVNWPLSA